MNKPLSALFYPQTVCLDHAGLKYMLLLYDRIFYLPNDTSLNPGHTRIPTRFSMFDSILFAAFGTRKDAHYGLMYSSEPDTWDDYMKGLMADYELLEQEGVCVALEDAAFSNVYALHPLQDAVDADVKDREFRYWCQRYQNEKLFLPSQPDNAKAKGGGMMIRPPSYQGDAFFTALCAERINACLYIAGRDDLVPVSNHDLFISLFGNKLKRALNNPDFKKAEGLREQRRKARFSQLSWNVVAEVVPPEMVAKRSVKELLKYKADSEDAAQRFRAYLFQLETMLESEPGDDKMREEIDKLVKAEILPELERLREKKATIWHQLFHESVKTVFSDAHLKALAPALTMHLLPAVSYVDLIFYSTALLTGSMLPKLLDARSSERDVRRNALFFVLKLAGKA